MTKNRISIPVMALAGLIILAAHTASAFTGVSAEVHRPDLVNVQPDALEIKPAPEKNKVLVPPALTIHFAEGWPEVSGEVGLEIWMQADAPAETEVRAYRDGTALQVLERRTLAGTGAWEILRWDVASADRITSLSMAMRSPHADNAVRIRTPNLRQMETLQTRFRLAAHREEPLAVQRAARPVSEQVLSVRLFLPESLKPLLHAANTWFEIEDDEGRSARMEVTMPLPIAGDRAMRNRADFDVALPDWAEGKVAVRLIVREREAEELAAELNVDLDPYDKPYFEVPYRSVQSFSVIERNGELVVYTVVSPEGASPDASMAPLPGDLLWLAVGNGEEWVVNEPLMQGRRDEDWLAGGMRDFAAGSIGRSTFGYFTMTTLDGLEGFCASQAVNSLRLTSLAQNPVWAPTFESELDAPTWRGNAFFNLNDSVLILASETPPGGTSSVRALASVMQTRWVNLGIIPLPDAPHDIEWMSGWQNGDEFHLLVGPGPCLYRASPSPLRDWAEVPIEMPESWERGQLAEWNGALWMFGLTRHNGRGIVTWAPAVREGDGFRVQEDYEFVPPPLLPTLGGTPMRTGSVQP